jgi:hypothetical protein
MKSGLSILALAMFFPLAAEGQAPGVAVGTRVRVTAPTSDLERHVTTIMDVRDDSIVVGVRGSSRTIGLADVTALEASTGRRRQVLRDALLGLGIGVVAGAAIGAITYEECVPQTFFDCMMAFESATESAAFGGILFGAAGLLTGAVVGVFDRKDSWAPVDLPVRAAIVPTRSGGVSVMLSRTF